MMYLPKPKPKNLPLIDYSHQELWNIITQEMEAVDQSIIALQAQAFAGDISVYAAQEEINRLEQLLVELEECRRSLVMGTSK